MIQFDFLRVLPADISRVGPLGACVLALVRYATAMDDGRHGRGTDADGAVWWRASQAEMAQALGVSHDSVHRIVSKLETASELEVFDPKDSSDRSFYYRVPDLSLRESAVPPASHNAESRCHNAKSRRPNAKSRSPLREIALCTIPLKNLKEVEEVGEAPAHAHPDIAPLPSEPKSPPGKAKTAKTRTANKPVPDGWRPTGEQMQRLAAKYPALDVEWELDAFIEKAGSDGWLAANWYLRFCRWLRTGGCSSKNYRTQYANNDDKVLGWLTVGLETQTPQLPQAFIEGEIA